LVTSSILVVRILFDRIHTSSYCFPDARAVRPPHSLSSCCVPTRPARATVLLCCQCRSRHARYAPNRPRATPATQLFLSVYVSIQTRLRFCSLARRLPPSLPGEFAWWQADRLTDWLAGSISVLDGVRRLERRRWPKVRWAIHGGFLPSSLSFSRFFHRDVPTRRDETRGPSAHVDFLASSVTRRSVAPSVCSFMWPCITGANSLSGEE
jgi:hypothetical protein